MDLIIRKDDGAILFVSGQACLLSVNQENQLVLGRPNEQSIILDRTSWGVEGVVDEDLMEALWDKVRSRSETGVVTLDLMAEDFSGRG